MSRKLPSYVFSKALAQNGEDKPRRQSLPPSWGSEGVPHIKVPPPVSAKPRSHIPPAIPEDSVDGDVGLGPRKSSLPTANERNRSSSSSSDKSDEMDVFGTGPKMGGAFARLQRQIEAKDSQRDVYSEAYQSYKAHRSLNAHGVLPKDMREDERKKKYSLDSGIPPVVLPKPISRLPSAEDRRQAFGKARAMTSPVSSNPPVFNGVHRAKDDVFVDSIAEIASAETGDSEFSPRVHPEGDTDVPRTSKRASIPGLPDEPPKIADPAAVEAMQTEYRKKQDLLAQGRQELENTISQLEHADDLLLAAHAHTRPAIDINGNEENHVALGNLKLTEYSSGKESSSTLHGGICVG